MSEPSSTHTEANSQQQKLVRAAAGVVAGSGNVVGVAKAMEVVGFLAEQRANMALYQKVRRLALKLSVVEAKENKPTPPPPAVEVNPQMESATSSLSGSSQTPNSGSEIVDEEVEVIPNGNPRRRLALIQ